MQSTEHIKRLIRELDLPDQADLVIQRAKYWSPAFCWLYFEKCDELIFYDACAGLQAAEVAPELVALVNRFSRDPGPRAPLLLRALAVLGSAYRAAGDLELSDQAYAEAFGLRKSKPIPKPDIANLLFRVAVLRSVQNRLEDAFALANESVDIYRRSDGCIKQQHLGEALIVRGYLHDLACSFALSMRDWSEALSCTDPQKKPRIHHCASHNLACSLVERAVDSQSLSRVGTHLKQARRLLSKSPRSVPKMRLLWLHGMIMVRFGSTRRGEAAFKSARKGFTEMDAPFDMALVSLDLGRYLYRSGQFAELRSLAVETRRVFSTMSSDQQTNQALAVWKKAVLTKTVSTQAFATTWQSVQQRVRVTSPDATRVI